MLVYISQLPPMDESNQHDGPYALIMAPTRELAQQIEQEATKFATKMGFRCVSLVGGVRISAKFGFFFLSFFFCSDLDSFLFFSWFLAFHGRTSV
jgi:hypothetical protein